MLGIAFCLEKMRLPLCESLLRIDFGARRVLFEKRASLGGGREGRIAFHGG